MLYVTGETCMNTHGFPPVMYYNTDSVVLLICKLFCGAPVDSHVVVNQYLRQDLISLVCFCLSLQTHGSCETR